MRALDLFAGPGGWSQACKALGIDELGIENDPNVCATAFAAGHPRACMDVRRWEDWSFVDGIIASPPCQTFSRAGVGSGLRDLDRVLSAVPLVATGTEIDWALGPDDYTPTWDVDDALFDLPGTIDRRTALVLEPMRFVRLIRPTWVALEQVPDVLPVWRAYGHALKGLGYHAVCGLLHAECYGVPQTRKRAILIAHRDHDVHLPPPTHSRYHGNPDELDEGLHPWVSMAEALGWGMTARPYPTVAAGTASGGTDPQALGGSGARTAVAQELDAGRWVSRVRVNDQSGTDRDPEWPTKRPATTVAGRDLIPDPGSNANRFNGATKSRNDGVRVSVAEAGVLQSFPADYPWSGSKTSQHQQVGDAIPPLMALAILRQVVT